MSTTSFPTATFHLNEFDIENIKYLEKCTGMNAADVAQEALLLCQKSLELRKQGYHTSVLHEMGLASSATIEHESIADQFNHRSRQANPADLAIQRTPQTLQALEDVKSSIQVTGDSIALAYALEYAAACERKIQQYVSARIFFTKTNDPYDGYVYKSCGFNKTLKNRILKLL